MAIRNADLETVLDAWKSATDRLQRTHAVLRDEVRRLTDELETKNRELARKNRLADLGQMAAHIAHEVRNSLVPLTLYVSLLRRRLEGQDDSISILTKIEAGFTALEATVTDLLQFTSHRDPHWAGFFVRAVVQDVIQSLAPQIEAQGIHVELDVPRHARVHADQQMMRRGILNLVLNALDAMPSGGELVITSWQNQQGWELEVADSGPGIAQEMRSRLFDPFFTTKSGGTGLGLAIVYRIAEVHGGDVVALNCPEGGAAITIRIPHRAKEIAA